MGEFHVIVSKNSSVKTKSIFCLFLEHQFLFNLLLQTCQVCTCRFNARWRHCWTAYA